MSYLCGRCRSDNCKHVPERLKKQMEARQRKEYEYQYKLNYRCPKCGENYCTGCIPREQKEAKMNDWITELQKARIYFSPPMPITPHNIREPIRPTLNLFPTEYPETPRPVHYYTQTGGTSTLSYAQHPGEHRIQISGPPITEDKSGLLVKRYQLKPGVDASVYGPAPNKKLLLLRRKK